MSEENITAESLIRFLLDQEGVRCPHCDEPVTAVDALKSRALGCRRRPRCLAGLAGFIGAEIPDLERQLNDYFSQRDCFRSAMEWAGSHDRRTDAC
jgi:hypothetical protein